MEKFINLDENEFFSQMKSTDLNELLSRISTYYLKYRDNLALSSDITFGTEIEYENVSKKVIDALANYSLEGWVSKKDGSLTSGGEIVSPIMHDDIKSWDELNLVCNTLEKHKANTSNNAGGHVHIGANYLGCDMDAWRCLIKLYIAYENVLMRFAYGDMDHARSGLYRYAIPVAPDLRKNVDILNKIKETYYLYDYFSNYDRYHSLNMHNVDFYHPNGKKSKNTIEFRFPNSSSSGVIWQNNINTFAKMMMSSKSKVICEDFLDYKIDKEFIGYNEYHNLYDLIDLKGVLEFVDLVFNNNLDKIYFLRQYLKDFKQKTDVLSNSKGKKFVL